MIGLGALSAGLFTTFATFGRRKWKHREGSPSAPGPQPSPQQQGPDVKRRLDTWLDEALQQTFPASDPISTPPYSALHLIARQEEGDDRDSSLEGRR
jgi:hypothetical protein